MIKTILGSSVLTYFLITLFTFFLIYSLFLRLKRQRIDIAEPALWFLGFYFTHYAIRAIYNITFESHILLGRIPEESVPFYMNLALIVGTIGLLSFFVGYKICYRHHITKSIPNISGDWHTKRILPLALVCLLIGWSVRYILLVPTGSSPLYLLLETPESRLGGYSRIVSDLAIVGLLLLLVSLKISKMRVNWIFFLSFASAEIMYGITSGSRGYILWIFISLFITAYLLSGRTYHLNLRLTVVAATIPLLYTFIFPLLDAIQRGGANHVLNEGTLSPIGAVESIGQRQDGLDAIALLLYEITRSASHTYGSEMMLILYSPIPRSLWENKPIVNLGTIFQQEFVAVEGGGQWGIAMTPVGQFYWSFNILGVVIGMIFIGLLFRVIYEKLVRPRGNLSNILIVGYMFPSFIIISEQNMVSLFTFHTIKFVTVIFVAYLLIDSSDT